MNIVAIDDEKLALELLVSAIEEAEPGVSVKAFRRADELLEFAEHNKIDIAFLDIELRNFSGLGLAVELKQKCPNVNIIFATGYSSYTLDAFSLHASGYLMKPVSSEAVKKELENLRNPLAEHQKTEKLSVQTFGNFEVFYRGKVVHFGRAKSKELFAYLIDRRGAAVTMAEIAAILWEDSAYTRSQLSQIHTFLTDLKTTLARIEAEDVLVKQWNHISVNVEAVDCDYYKFLKGDIRAVNAFTGEYMANYSWAELTVGTLVQKKEGKG